MIAQTTIRTYGKPREGGCNPWGLRGPNRAWPVRYFPSNHVRAVE